MNKNQIAEKNCFASLNDYGKKFAYPFVVLIDGQCCNSVEALNDIVQWLAHNDVQGKFFFANKQVAGLKAPGGGEYVICFYSSVRFAATSPNLGEELMNRIQDDYISVHSTLPLD